MERTSFTLWPFPPFNLRLTAWALRRRPANQVDRWDGSNYSRIFTSEGAILKVSASQGGIPEKPQLNVSLAGKTAGAQETRSRMASILEEMFSLGRDLGDFYSLSGKDQRLKPLAARFLGMKPPRFPTVFEALVNALACQQVSLDLGIILLNRLSHSYGPSGKTKRFPTPFQDRRSLQGFRRTILEGSDSAETKAERSSNFLKESSTKQSIWRTSRK
jgi:DNA-3-methyladenine glycosylase II